MNPTHTASAVLPLEVEIGTFRDRQTTYHVAASSEHAPESAQVYADGNRADIVLVLSGLSTEHPRATWGAQWRARSPEWDQWREWMQEETFRAIYRVREPAPVPLRAVRFCNG